jgi:hypothetical protein
MIFVNVDPSNKGYPHCCHGKTISLGPSVYFEPLHLTRLGVILREAIEKDACYLLTCLRSHFLIASATIILLRPRFPPFDLALDCCARQVLKKPLWQSKRLGYQDW